MILWWGVGTIILFYILILLVGIWASRKTRHRSGDGSTTTSQEDMMLAGRNIGIVLGCFTMTATWVDGGYINGTAEAIFTQGLVWCQAPFGYALSLIIGGVFFAGPMRSAGYVTMVDAFQRRYGERIGGILFIPAAMGETFWTAAVLAALGSTLTVILEIQFSISVICSAIFAAFYCGVGGAWSIAYTDCVQLSCLFIGLWLSVPFALSNPAVEPIFPNFHKWSGKLERKDLGEYIDLGLLLCFGGIAWQSYFQRVLSANSVQKARVLSIVAGCACFLMSFPSILLGACAVNARWSNVTGYGHDTIVDSVMTLPLVLRYLTPMPVAVIGMGAISAAVMSSTDASVFSAASMFARNIYKMVLRPNATDREIIWVLRCGVVVVATLATLLAIFLHSVYALWLLCSDLVYVILFPELTCVLFYRHANGYGAVSGFVVGLVLRLIGGEHLIGLPATIAYPMFEAASKEYPHGRQRFPFRTLSMLCCFATIFLASEITWRLLRRYPSLAKYDFLDSIEKQNTYDRERAAGLHSTAVAGNDVAPSEAPRQTRHPLSESMELKRPPVDFAVVDLRNDGDVAYLEQRQKAMEHLPWIEDDELSLASTKASTAQIHPNGHQQVSANEKTLRRLQSSLDKQRDCESMSGRSSRNSSKVSKKDGIPVVGKLNRAFLSSDGERQEKYD